MENHMKKLILASALGLSALVGMSAHGATATGNFDVTINLTSACKLSTAPTAAFTYTSFQATAATFSSSFNIMCTKTLPISSIALDTATVTDDATDLAYTLTMGAAPATGTGAAQSVTLTGSMAANQAGKCATATCTNAAATNKQRTITITY
jgi:hypothetical protein